MTDSLPPDLPDLGARLLRGAEHRPLDIPILGFSLGSAWSLERYKGADGLVISCPGASSLAKATRSEIARELLPRMPVVLASRCEDSHADMSDQYPGYVEEVEGLGFRVRDFVGPEPPRRRASSWRSRSGRRMLESN